MASGCCGLFCGVVSVPCAEGWGAFCVPCAGDDNGVVVGAAARGAGRWCARWLPYFL